MLLTVWQTVLKFLLEPVDRVSCSQQTEVAILVSYLGLNATVQVNWSLPPA